MAYCFGPCASIIQILSLAYSSVWTESESSGVEEEGEKEDGEKEDGEKEDGEKEDGEDESDDLQRHASDPPPTDFHDEDCAPTDSSDTPPP